LIDRQFKAIFLLKRRDHRKDLQSRFRPDLKESVIVKSMRDVKGIHKHSGSRVTKSCPTNPWLDLSRIRMEKQEEIPRENDVKDVDILDAIIRNATRSRQLTEGL
jgi:hypothetical protein